MAGFVKLIGPTGIEFNSVDIGDSQGGVRVRATIEKADAFKDKRGRNPVDSIVVGTVTEVEVLLTDLTLTQMAAVTPGAVMSGNRFVLSTAVGTSARDGAQVLILKPIINGIKTTDESKWLNFPLAYPFVDAEMVFTNEDQQIWKCTFQIFEDEATDVIANFGTVT